MGRIGLSSHSFLIYILGKSICMNALHAFVYLHACMVSEPHTMAEPTDFLVTLSR
ncbi:unnamed protein product, partial [Vitis vinifera]|uniref:Uncharacterized protein n=1 Tax=Vitis vinifera TaxID=29760 RepID=D7TD35_VITVI